MATDFENFVNTELPRRIGVENLPAGGNFPAGKRLVTTGVGLGVRLEADDENSLALNPAFNNTGSVIARNTPVELDPNGLPSGSVPTVKPVDDEKDDVVLGIVYADIADGQMGKVVTRGYITLENTVFNQPGAKVYADKDAGYTLEATSLPVGIVSTFDVDAKTTTIFVSLEGSSAGGEAPEDIVHAGVFAYAIGLKATEDMAIVSHDAFDAEGISCKAASTSASLFALEFAVATDSEKLAPTVEILEGGADVESANSINHEIKWQRDSVAGGLKGLALITADPFQGGKTTTDIWVKATFTYGDKVTIKTDKIAVTKIAAPSIATQLLNVPSDNAYLTDDNVVDLNVTATNFNRKVVGIRVDAEDSAIAKGTYMLEVAAAVDATASFTKLPVSNQVQGSYDVEIVVLFEDGLERSLTDGTLDIDCSVPKLANGKVEYPVGQSAVNVNNEFKVGFDWEGSTKCEVSGGTLLAANRNVTISGAKGSAEAELSVKPDATTNDHIVTVTATNEDNGRQVTLEIVVVALTHAPKLHVVLGGALGGDILVRDEPGKETIHEVFVIASHPMQEDVDLSLDVPANNGKLIGYTDDVLADDRKIFKRKVAKDGTVYFVNRAIFNDNDAEGVLNWTLKTAPKGGSGIAAELTNTINNRIVGFSDREYIVAAYPANEITLDRKVSTADLHVFNHGSELFQSYVDTDALTPDSYTLHDGDINTRGNGDKVRLLDINSLMMNYSGQLRLSVGQYPLNHKVNVPADLPVLKTTLDNGTDVTAGSRETFTIANMAEYNACGFRMFIDDVRVPFSRVAGGLEYDTPIKLGEFKVRVEIFSLYDFIEDNK